MKDTIVFIAAIFILFYLLKYDAAWLRYRAELIFAMAGIDYKPSKNIAFIFAAIVFYIVYGVIFGR